MYLLFGFVLFMALFCFFALLRFVSCYFVHCFVYFCVILLICFGCCILLPWVFVVIVLFIVLFMVWPVFQRSPVCFVGESPSLRMRLVLWVLVPSGVSVCRIIMTHTH